MTTNTNTIAGHGLLTCIVLLWTIWFLGSAFYTVPMWFHAIGALAFVLTLLRIFRGDD